MSAGNVQDQKLRPLNLEAGRRAFMQTLGLGAAAAAVMGANVAPAQAQTVSEGDVLNFALNLEYVEAEFYLRAATGSGLADSDTTGLGNLGPVTGGRQVPITTNMVGQLVRELARDELAHVRLLRSALGGAAVARPAIDLVNSFNNFAIIAGLVPAGSTFDAFANETNFLLASFVFEDVGVTAYKGATPLIRNSVYLETAAGILAVEAYHAGIIRSLLYGRGLYSQANQISGLRNYYDGPSNLDAGIGDANFGDLVPNDVNAVAYSRSPSQVLAVVYGSGTAQPGGFFPAGFNGNVR